MSYAAIGKWARSIFLNWGRLCFICISETFEASKPCPWVFCICSWYSEVYSPSMYIMYGLDFKHYEITSTPTSKVPTLTDCSSTLYGSVMWRKPSLRYGNSFLFHVTSTCYIKFCIHCDGNWLYLMSVCYTFVQMLHFKSLIIIVWLLVEKAGNTPIRMRYKATNTQNRTRFEC